MGAPLVHGFSEMSLGSTYTDEELEFLKAIDRYKRSQNRPFPTWIEVLNVLRQLGWAKVTKQEVK